MRIGFAAGLFVTLACACQDLHAPPTGDRAGAKVSATAPAPAPAGTALTPTPAPAPPPAAAAEAETLPWIHDDYAAALADAKKRNLPVAIDMWAPWCHTCLSMQATVLADKSFAPLADRFVWLSIDTDKPQNAAVLEKFPVAMWPTFYVVSPAAEAIEARHLGAASVAQFRRFLAAGERGHLAAQDDAGQLEKGTPLYHVRRGDRAAAAGDDRAAARAYGAALAKAPANWPRRPEVLVMQIAALAEAEAWPPCAKLAAKAVDATGTAGSAADFCYWGDKCAGHLTDKAFAKDLRRRLVARIEKVVGDPRAPLSIDDRSEALRIEREILLAMGEADAARKVAERQKTLLDLAAKRAETPAQAMTYNNHRVDVYLFLGQGKALVPALRAQVAKLPGAYDPAYRLAQLYAGLDQYDAALAMGKRALGLAYGPRQAGIARFIAGVQHDRGDAAGELAARKEVVKLLLALPESQRDPEDLTKARAALAALTR